MSSERFTQGEVRAIGRGGDAVVETARGVVFVPGALPGERVQIELTSSKRGAARGRLKRIDRRAPGRVDPACPVATRCGGCPLMSADAALQRDIKLGFLRDACRGLPGADEVEAEWVASPNALGYRRRARLGWHGSTLGYRQLHSKRVTDIRECLVVRAPLQTAWVHTREALAEVLQGAGEIQLQLTAENRTVVGLTTDDLQGPALFEACAALAEHAAIAGVTLRAGDSVAAASWGDTTVVIGSAQGELHGPPGGFSQANDGINAALVQAVVDLAEPEGMRVLELHCGIGNFTVQLASRAPAALVAVERDPGAVEACRSNLERRGLQARVAVRDANQPPKGRYDVLVLDPPRHGARELFEKRELPPRLKRIVYVSCDTATLARDLRLATAQGYRIDRVIGFDMFPQTAHLESLVRLVRV